MTKEERENKFRQRCKAEIVRRFQSEGKAGPAELFFGDYLDDNPFIMDTVATLSTHLIPMYAEEVVTGYMSDLPKGPLKGKLTQDEI